MLACVWHEPAAGWRLDLVHSKQLPLPGHAPYIVADQLALEARIQLAVRPVDGGHRDWFAESLQVE